MNEQDIRLMHGWNAAPLLADKRYEKGQHWLLWLAKPKFQADFCDAASRVADLCRRLFVSAGFHKS